MRPVIVPRADLEGRGEREGTARAAARHVLRSRGAAQSHSELARRDFRAIFGGSGPFAGVMGAAGFRVSVPLDGSARHRCIAAPRIISSGHLDRWSSQRAHNVCQDARRDVFNRFHVLRFATAFHEQKRNSGARACPNSGGANPHRNGASQ